MDSAVSRRELADALTDVRMLVLTSTLAAIKAGSEGNEGEAFHRFLDQITTLQKRIDALADQH